MGQRVEREGMGRVRMGRKVVEEIRGVGLGASAGEGIELTGWGGGRTVWGGEERETVLGCWVVGWEVVDGGKSFLEGDGRPDMTGGGRSSPSAALRESWRAKSEACHHSRNLSAKMEVGRRILRLERRRGRIVVANVRGLKMLEVCGRPGRELADGVIGRDARAIARWSVSPRRRIRVPIR